MNRRYGVGVVTLFAAATWGCDQNAVPSDLDASELRGGNGARADDCRGTIGAISVEEVNVPAGATCTLEGTRVRGNVFVRTDAQLIANGVRVDGNIQSEDAAVVRVADSVVEGDVQVKRRTATEVVRTTIDGNLQLEERGARLVAADNIIGGNLQFVKADAATITGTEVDGDLQLFENVGRLDAERNRVMGNMQVFKNRGGVTLTSNRVSQSLQCGENEPAPVGGANVAGEKEGQCARL